jgi:hypothetical protein
MAPSPESKGLSPEQEEQIGHQNARLLLGPVDWIVRRRETVEIADEKSLRRQITVDFSLPEEPSPERLPDRGYCAPILVLPKKPSHLMSFDLVDDDGKTLPLAARLENARISAATIKAMAELVLGGRAPQHPSYCLPYKLAAIARAPAPDGELAVDRLLSSEAARFGDGDLKELADHPRFRWWLFTLSHSSILMVPSPAPGKRGIVKLSFREPILSEMSWRTGIGWTPYSVHVDSSFIGAQSFHFEAHSPAGLRIDNAVLASDRPPESDEGMLRRAHLYLPNAEDGQAATAGLSLRVAGSGFVRDAWLASLLVTAAIAACLIWAENIVRDSSTAPALLLLLPGLIATYLGRPDHHGLTQRLLAWTRRTLMLSALLAYVTAARLALAGPTPKKGEIDNEIAALECFLGFVLFFAVIASGVLILARISSDHLLRGWMERIGHWLKRCWRFAGEVVRGEFAFDQDVGRKPDEIAAAVEDTARKVCGPDSDPEGGSDDPWSFLIVGPTRLTSFALSVQLHPAREGARVECGGHLDGKNVFKATRLWRTIIKRRQTRKAFEAFAKELDSNRYKEEEGEERKREEEERASVLALPEGDEDGSRDR